MVTHKKSTTVLLKYVNVDEAGPPSIHSVMKGRTPVSFAFTITFLKEQKFYIIKLVLNAIVEA